MSVDCVLIYSLLHSVSAYKGIFTHVFRAHMILTDGHKTKSLLRGPLQPCRKVNIGPYCGVSRFIKCNKLQHTYSFIKCNFMVVHDCPPMCHLLCYLAFCFLAFKCFTIPTFKVFTYCCDLGHDQQRALHELLMVTFTGSTSGYCCTPIKDSQEHTRNHSSTGRHSHRHLRGLFSHVFHQIMSAFKYESK